MTDRMALLYSQNLILSHAVVKIVIMLVANVGGSIGRMLNSEQIFIMNSNAKIKNDPRSFDIELMRVRKSCKDEVASMHGMESSFYISASIFRLLYSLSVLYLNEALMLKVLSSQSVALVLLVLV